MDLTVTLRRAWVRNRTHTVVFDRDPDFVRFSQDPTGEVQGRLQIWAQGEAGGAREYLGSLRLCSGRFDPREVLRLYHRVEDWARRCGEPPEATRRAIGRWLRQVENPGISSDRD